MSEIEFNTNPDYWDCECNDSYIHKKESGNYCLNCRKMAEDQPDSIEDEIKLNYKPENDKNIIEFELTDSEYNLRLRRLAADMIHVTMLDIEKPKSPPPNKANALYWLNEDRGKGMFSFHWCCEILNLNKDRIRKGILDIDTRKANREKTKREARKRKRKKKGGDPLGKEDC